MALARTLGFDGPGAIRVDSGNLPAEARRARALLDELGASRPRIVVSGDLDEYVIDALEGDRAGRAPIDSYGVGTRLVTGSGHPTAGFVYKLVAIADTPDAGAPLRPVSKTSRGKETLGHRKTAFRVLDGGGHTTAELLTIGDVGPPGARPLQYPVVRMGERCPGSLEAAHDHHHMARAELPPHALDLRPGEPALSAVLHEGSLR